ncbi:MAG: MaoC/PaaZ C-terminal domain-containing protein [Chloroflexota bacterium]
MTLARARGLYFEQFVVGEQVESPGRTVTEGDVYLFAGLSGDHNLIHCDAEFAKATPFGQRIAHGLLGLALASGLAVQCGFIAETVQAFVGLTWKFKGPVFFGDTIRVRAQVASTRALPSMGGGLVVMKVEVLNQRQEVVQQGEWQMLIKGQPQD